MKMELIATEQELIPIKYKMSDTVNADLMLAELYEAAGMNMKADNIRKKSILAICKENKMEVLQTELLHDSKAYDDSINRPYSSFHYDGISDYQGMDWKIEEVNEYLKDVPVALLKQMTKVKEKSRLWIGTPVSKHIAIPDPILLYRLPYLPNCYIELARWE